MFWGFLLNIIVIKEPVSAERGFTDTLSARPAGAPDLHLFTVKPNAALFKMKTNKKKTHTQKNKTLKPGDFRKHPSQGSSDNQPPRAQLCRATVPVSDGHLLRLCLSPGAEATAAFVL